MLIQCVCKKIYDIHTNLGEFIPDFYIKDKFYKPYIRNGRKYVRFVCNVCKRSYEIELDN